MLVAVQPNYQAGLPEWAKWERKTGKSIYSMKDISAYQQADFLDLAYFAYKREAAHKGAMLGYDAGMQMARRAHGNELEIAELTVKELTERVKELEMQMIASQQ